MIRTVEEIQAQTEEAHEKFVMDKIEKAANERKTSVMLKCDDVPTFLRAKLRQYGYKLKYEQRDLLDSLTISWEV